MVQARGCEGKQRYLLAAWYHLVPLEVCLDRLLPRPEPDEVFVGALEEGCDVRGDLADVRRGDGCAVRLAILHRRALDDVPTETDVPAGEAVEQLEDP